MLRMLIIICLMFVLVGCGNASADSMAGTWKSSDPHMVARVSGGTIHIDWIGDDTRALYWVGSFPKRMKPGTRTVPIGRVSVMETALLASTQTHKGFAFRGGQLVFSVSAFGVTMTTRMHR